MFYQLYTPFGIPELWWGGSAATAGDPVTKRILQCVSTAACPSCRPCRKHSSSATHPCNPKSHTPHPWQHPYSSQCIWNTLWISTLTVIQPQCICYTWCFDVQRTLATQIHSFHTRRSRIWTTFSMAISWYVCLQTHAMVVLRKHCEIFARDEPSCSWHPSHQWF